MLTLGEAYEVTMEAGETVYAAFTAPADGEYSFTSVSSSDTYGYLYNAAFREITYDDDSGSGNNFKMTHTMTAGETVYVGARYYSSSNSGSFSLAVSKALEKPVMTVSTTTPTMGDEVTVTWDAVEGATYYRVYANDSDLSGELTDTGYTFVCMRMDSIHVRAYNDVGDYASSDRQEMTVSMPENTTALTLYTEEPVTLAAGEAVAFTFTAPKDASYWFTTNDEADNA